MDLAPIKVAGILDKDPIKEPIGVLFASTITTLLNDINPILSSLKIATNILPYRMNQT